MAIEINLKPVYRKLLRVKDPKTRKKIMRGGLRAAAGVQAKQVRKTVPVETGALKRAITTKGQRRGDMFASSVRARNTGDGDRNPARYLHLVERGTAPHFQAGPLLLRSGPRSNVQHPGARAYRVLEKAANSHRRASIAAFQEYLRRELRKL